MDDVEGGKYWEGTMQKKKKPKKKEKKPNESKNERGHLHPTGKSHQIKIFNWSLQVCFPSFVWIFNLKNPTPLFYRHS